MINPKRVNRQIDMPVIDFPTDPGGDGAYKYVLCAPGQTVDYWTTGTTTTSITLTAGKSFASIHYRSLNKSIYVLGASYFDRIDADPTSGTFNTVVESGATIMTTPKNYCYLPWPIDAFAGQSIPRWVPVKFINSQASIDLEVWTSKDTNKQAVPTFGHGRPQNMTLHPRMKMLQLDNIDGSGPILFDILDSSKDVMTSAPYIFKRRTLHSDLGQSNAKTFCFGSWMPMITNGSLYPQHHEYGMGGLVPFGSLATGLGSSYYIMGFAPNNDPTASGVSHQGILFIGTKTLNVVVKAYSVNFNGAMTLVATLDRSAYIAANSLNEDSTDDIMYCPYDGYVYVKAHRHSSLTTGINRIYRYNPYPGSGAGPALVDVITANEMCNTDEHGNYTVNKMCMNQTRYWEAPDVIL